MLVVSSGPSGLSRCVVALQLQTSSASSSLCAQRQALEGDECERSVASFGGRHCHCWRSSRGLAGSPVGRWVLPSPGSLASVRGAAVEVSGQRARHVQGGRSGANGWQRARHVIGRHALGARACVRAMSPHKQWLCSVEPVRESMRRPAAAWALHCQRDVGHHFLHLRGPCQIVSDLSVSTTW